MAQRRRIRLLIPKGSITGEDSLIRDRLVPWVMRERGSQLRRGGARTSSERASDTAHRNFGIPVYDRQTAQAHLADIMHRGRSKPPG